MLGLNNGGAASADPITRRNPEGSAFDKLNGLLYFAQGGKDPVIHVLRVR